jgi:hypothetical protein
MRLQLPKKDKSPCVESLKKAAENIVRFHKAQLERRCGQ